MIYFLTTINFILLLFTIYSHFKFVKQNELTKNNLPNQFNAKYLKFNEFVRNSFDIEKISEYILVELQNILKCKTLFFCNNLFEGSKESSFIKLLHNDKFYSDHDLFDDFEQNILSKIAPNNKELIIKLNTPFKLELYKNEITFNKTLVVCIYFNEVLYGIIGCSIKDEDKISESQKTIIKMYAGELALVLSIYKAISVSNLISNKVFDERKTYKVAFEIEKDKDKNNNELFLSTVTHEFRNPIAIIQTSAILIKKILQKSPVNIELILQQANKINNIGKRMELLLSSLVSYERFNNNEIKLIKKEIYLKELISTIVEINQNLYQDYDIKCDINNLPEIYETDTKLLEIIIENLLNNAIKYSKNNKVILINTKESEHEFVISIIDHGIGIPKEEQEKVFNKHFRASNANGTSGTGIGLYICNKFCEILGMKLKVTSEINNGSNFSLYLPKTI